MVEITIGRGGQLQSTEADVVQCLVVKQEALIGVLHKLVEAEDRIVWLDHRVRHLGARNHTEGLHDSVRVLLAHLADEECTHARSGPASKRMAHLESLEAITALSLLTDHVQDAVDQLSPFRPM